MFAMPRQSRSTALCALLVLCVRAYKPDRSPIAPVAGRRAALQWLGTAAVATGAGNEPDTFMKNTVYVMDTKAFPFHTAEIYHQFHNDFKGPRYPAAYNALKDLSLIHI